MLLFLKSMEQISFVSIKKKRQDKHRLQRNLSMLPNTDNKSKPKRKNIFVMRILKTIRRLGL